MDEQAKIAYQQKVETYLEKNGIYDFFEELMTEIVYEKPIDVVDFLIQRIDSGPRHRYFLVGPTGFKKYQIAPVVAKKLGIEVISTADIIKEEIHKNSTLGKSFEEHVSKWEFIRDDALTKAVMDRIQVLEKSRTGYILVGFPRTRLQCLALQKANIVPTKVLIQHNYDVEKFKMNYYNLVYRKAQGESARKYSMIITPEMVEIAKNGIQEYELNIRDVQSIYKDKVYYLETDKELSPSITEAMTVIGLPVRSLAPRTPPKVAVVGPAGSGRSTQATILAESIGLVYISTQALILDAENRASDFAATIQQARASGAEVPVSIVTTLLGERLAQRDCQVCGYVIDGYPKTVEEATALENSGYELSKVIFLEASDEVATSRYEARKYDPVTGDFYEEGSLPDDSEIAGRLVQAPGLNLTSELQAYREAHEGLVEYFGSRGIEVPEGSSIAQVGEIIENSLSLPITS